MNRFLSVQTGLALFSSMVLLSCHPGEQNYPQNEADAKPKLTADQVFHLVEDGTIPEPLGDCLQQWGPENTPFDETAVRQYLSLNFNGDDVSYKDIFMTETPKLTFLEISADEVGDIKLRLMNPNGWYCLNVAVTSMEDFTVKVHCEAKILQSILESADADDIRFKQVCDDRSIKDIGKKEEGVVGQDDVNPDDIVPDDVNPDDMAPGTDDGLVDMGDPLPRDPQPQEPIVDEVQY